MKIRKHIPNTITSMNLLCGILGVIACFYGRVDIAFLLMLLASVFDFLDGFAARMLNAYSELGKELDSLADDVSFGVLPAIMLFVISVLQGGGGAPYMVAEVSLWSLVPFIIAPFSAVRLAKFNLDERQHGTFIGLPTPACAMICGSLAYFVYKCPDSWLGDLCASIWFIPTLSVVLSLLLVSEFPMFAMKFNTGEKSDRVTFILRALFFAVVAASAALAIIWGINWSIVPLLSFCSYVIINLCAAPYWYMEKRSKRK